MPLKYNLSQINQILNKYHTNLQRINLHKIKEKLDQLSVDNSTQIMTLESILIHLDNTESIIDVTTLEQLLFSNTDLLENIAYDDALPLLTPSFNARRIQFLTQVSNPLAYAQFLHHTDSAAISEEIVYAWLKTLNKKNNLSAAMMIFNYSKRPYTIEQLPLIKLFAELLSNPLCEAVLDARNISFSDYATPSDPLENAAFSNALINKISESQTEFKRIQLFYDILISIRPYPCSQKYMNNMIPLTTCIRTLLPNNNQAIIFNILAMYITNDLYYKSNFDTLFEDLLSALQQIEQELTNTEQGVKHLNY